MPPSTAMELDFEHIRQARARLLLHRDDLARSATPDRPNTGTAVETETRVWDGIETGAALVITRLEGPECSLGDAQRWSDQVDHELAGRYRLGLYRIGLYRISLGRLAR